MAKKDKLKGHIIIIHDTETTGILPEDRIIESAYIHIENGKVEFKEELNKAPVPIKPAAAMTHGYTNKMVENLGSFKSTEGFRDLQDFALNGAVYVAHNAPFDLTMLEKEGLIWNNNVIDTLRVAKHMYQDHPEVEMHKLQYFRYLFEWDDQPWFKGFMDRLEVDEIKPHTALSDVLILWIFLEHMMDEFNLKVEDMIELSKQPILEKRINFGNIFKKKEDTYEWIIENTYFQYNKEKNGYEYLDWACTSMENLNMDTEYSIKYHMAYGVLEKKIPMTNTYKKYLNWGIMFCFSDKEIRIALEMMGEPNTFRKAAFNSVLKRQEELGVRIRSSDEINEKDVEALRKSTFMTSFMIASRSKLLNI